MSRKDWKPPQLKGAKFEGRDEVDIPLIDSVEIWSNAKGYYVYFRYKDGSLVYSSGPSRLQKTASDNAKANAKALKAGKAHIEVGKNLY